MSALIIALLLGLQQHIVNQTSQIAVLTEEVQDLRTELQTVPQMQQQIATLQAHQIDVEYRVAALETAEDHK